MEWYNTHVIEICRKLHVATANYLCLLGIADSRLFNCNPVIQWLGPGIFLLSQFMQVNDRIFQIQWKDSFLVSFPEIVYDTM